MNNNDKEHQLILLKQETCGMIEKNNSAYERISEINRILSEKENKKLKDERQTLTAIAKENSVKIFKNYESIVALEKEINGRDINPYSPFMQNILYDWQNSKPIK